MGMPFSYLARWLNFIERFWIRRIERNCHEDQPDSEVTKDSFGNEGTLVKAQMNSFKKAPFILM
ncbi:hypothetical protein B2D45_14330 [Lactobacillus hilgardii]|uniref:Uncharacterized protein n=1 Tax=Lentilactobacillus hilgardii (strain ATCC 8290 / DSM 20176 / CCUG 30140 / JCM 1155 / KCTC 3500 / NBRC 15886 / NCIMB 8040 / NRRL B-1843 / 9) TaxID=1423757 RepID=C0XK93_LENH9|nr:hypothetical protein HMPREF0497_0873 [Lentilactobacillus buchneri ATCC 11577]EEI24203.1 hypothetical protein HMPREF0519_1654 [Lentilactobacillus hilgardii DSM 20176 = ATCC 8290]MCT3396925.1 hypothetical protein [Lentilactobacillus hilgardii]QEU39741.1 hypothetical protein LH500_02860 [Lentilactobacillus hilgardii]